MLGHGSVCKHVRVYELCVAISSVSEPMFAFRWSHDAKQRSCREPNNETSYMRQIRYTTLTFWGGSLTEQLEDHPHTEHE